MKIEIASLVAFAAACTCIGALPVLIDINRAGSGDTATQLEFAVAGVEEDLSGATVTGISVVSTTGNSFSGAGLTFTFSPQYNASYDVGPLGSDENPSGNALLDDYVYLNSLGDGPGPVSITLTGLSDVLSPQTRYRLYLFGTAGNNEAQNAEFTYPPGGVPKTTSILGTLRDASVSFYFTTDSVVSDSLTFDWARVGSNQYSAFNGVAITLAKFQTVQVPTISWIGIIGSDVDILFDGKTSHDYILECSLDLKNWTALPVEPVVEQNVWKFVDSGAAALGGARYYRISAQLASF